MAPQQQETKPEGASYVDFLQDRLQRAEAEILRLNSVELERERWKTAALSLSRQLRDEQMTNRKGTTSREERYFDTRLQVQDLKEALAIKVQEVEELKAARHHLPASEDDLYLGYMQMTEVFESLRSTLSCSLCYEPYLSNTATTLECGHTTCANCMAQWDTTRHRLYNKATTPDCPECRAPGRHYVKVYLLEEVVRTVERLNKLELREEERKLAIRKEALLKRNSVLATTNKAARPGATFIDYSDSDDTEIEKEERIMHEDLDGGFEVVSVNPLLLERSRQRYAGPPAVADA